MKIHSPSFYAIEGEVAAGLRKEAKTVPCSFMPSPLSLYLPSFIPLPSLLIFSLPTLALSHCLCLCLFLFNFPLPNVGGSEATLRCACGEFTNDFRLPLSRKKLSRLNKWNILLFALQLFRVLTELAYALTQRKWSSPFLQHSRMVFGRFGSWASVKFSFFGENWTRRKMFFF